MNHSPCANRSYSLTKSGLVAIASLALFLPAGKAAIIVSDDFSGAVDGTNINGRVTPVGGATWTSASGVGYTSSSIYNGGVTADGGGYGIFTVPFSVGSSTSFEIQASVKPQSNNLNLIFATNVDALQINGSTTIMGAINGGGGWGLFNGSAFLAGGGGLGNPTPYATAVLSYDVTSHTLTFSYNGTQLYQGVTYLNESGSGSNGLADITRAGFSYNGIATNTTNPEFDSFTLVAVPEPQTWALAGLGSLVLILRSRSRKRKLTA